MEKARPSRDDDEDEDEVPKPKGKKKGKKGKKKAAGSPVMMYVLLGIGAIVLLSGGAAGVYYGFIQEDAKPTNSTTQAPGGPGAPVGQASINTAGWVEINEVEGKYRLKFPKQPSTQNVQQQTPAGPITLKRYLADGQSDAFLSTHVPLPDRGGLTDDQLLDQAAHTSQSLAPSKGATISNPKAITYQSLPGREFVMTLTGKRGSMIIRVILASDRIIVLTAGGDNATSESPRVRTFFDSLKIE